MGYGLDNSIMSMLNILVWIMCFSCLGCMLLYNKVLQTHSLSCSPVDQSPGGLSGALCLGSQAVSVIDN